MPEELRYTSELRRLVTGYTKRLAALDDAAIRRRPGPGKWSVAEVVGHLVDSAAHNHQRFVRGPRQDTLVFDGYGQDDWVAAQHYQDADFKELLALWRGYNLHLARVMELMPAAERKKSYIRHNFDQVAFRPMPAGTPATLDWFMEDYVEHLKHHLKQIDSLLRDTDA
jgi:hypothetical protein